MTYPCPNCGAPASLESGCPTCGRGPDHDAAEVIRTDAEIGALIAELATAQHVVRDLEIRINQAWQRRHAAAARVRTTAAPKRGNGVQTLLFVLGGLLLGSAAIVFAAVAWSQFGMAGRATLLAVATVAALAVPPVALRRGLTATAETMAAVGLLLTLLDGYAAWYVNLLGVTRMSPARYAGLVFAVTAATATAYALLTHVTAARYAALVAFQPALPLLVAPAHPGAAGWSLTFGALAALNLVAANPTALKPALGPVALGSVARRLPAAYGFAVVSILVAFVPAAVSGLNTLVTATPFFHAAWPRTVPGPGWQLPAALALVTAVLFGTVPPRLRLASLFGGAAVIALALPAGLRLPWWNGPIVDLVVVSAALFLAARRAAPALHVPAARAAALSAAASPAIPNTAATAVRIATSDSLVTFVSQLVTAALLSAHALIAGFGRPATAAAVLTTIALLGAGVAARARSATPISANATTANATTANATIANATIANATTANEGSASAEIASPPSAGAGRVSAASANAANANAASVNAASAGANAASAGANAASAGANAAGAGASAAGTVLSEVGLFVALSAIPAIAWTTTAALELSAVAQVRAVAAATVAALLLVGLAARRPGAPAAAPGLVLTLLGVTVAAPAGTVLEAYTIIASVLALAAAIVARRDHTPSWATYGPALIGGLLPSLALVLTHDGEHLRRLLLGIAALAVLLAGARLRLRAPLLAGAGTLGLVALHEIGLVWDLIPRWIPLAAGGLLLVVLAATLEARRRDLARFRRALGRMS
ncbi:SCO7613 C-terminal domain-containing membrane protein [Paractinoplanes rhizophilus]|uniref:SCO7613 C-terminal domain-containing membrane protein n=1 Tax=Paractinoplanes rhizophilus TaxID=1416877 RepID=A0ABW2HTF5_9ACTN